MSTDSKSNADDEQIPAETRESVKDDDGHRCQLCDAAGPGAGGVAVLHVHHKSKNPDDCEYHDSENLITLCVQCHNWFHNQPEADDAPVVLSEDAENTLLSHDFEILRILGNAGPLTTSEITQRLTADVETLAVRTRCWFLMGLTKVVNSQETHVLDQEVGSGEWGLPGQISKSERGRIPESKQAFLQRVEDERVRRALNRGKSRKEVADVLDLHPRTTRYKQKRARAYEFPLDAFMKHGRPPRTTDKQEEIGEVTSDKVTSGESDGISEPDEVWSPESTGSEETGRSGDEKVNECGDDAGTSNGDDESVSDECGMEESVQASLQEAISALNRVEKAL